MFFILVYCLVKQDAYKLEKVEPVLSGEQLDNAVKPIIQEYLEHGDTAEVEVTSYSHWHCCTKYYFENAILF